MANFRFFELQWNSINEVTNGPQKFGHINEGFFYKKMYGGFCQVATKRGHNNKVARWP